MHNSHRYHYFTEHFISVIDQCYEEKGRGAADSTSDIARHWLKGFVASVGGAKAKELLAGSGSFVRLE